mmetsp:Transcript_12710/g.22858  ORF Transcript_12710/g.22858 Transcript_12710/m.22858 type:complete len:101 (+) Transcript_12710:1-303(+)
MESKGIDAPQTDTLATSNDEKHRERTISPQGSPATTTLEMFSSSQSKVMVSVSEKNSINSLDETRQRMRAEAARDTTSEQSNPWFMAASYLAKKAFGKKD